MAIVYTIPKVSDYSEGLDWYYHSVYDNPDSGYNYVWARLCDMNNPSDTIACAAHYMANVGIGTIYGSNKSSFILSYKGDYSSTPISQWEGVTETRNDNVSLPVHSYGVYYGSKAAETNVVDIYLPADSVFDSYESAVSAMIQTIGGVYPITYRLTNCTAPSAPTEAVIGDTVTVPFQFTSGYGFVNPSSDVYVTNNGVVIPSQYSNGVLTFTMPDPS